ncbi:hypothetical protein WDW86_19775 [Bdellovibrionota bacterium FG-2]
MKSPEASADSSLGIEARFPLGIEWILPSIPLGLAIEIVPGLSVRPKTAVALHGGFAVRYYF